MKSVSNELFGGLLILASMAILGLSDNLFYFTQDVMGLGQFHALRAFLSILLLVPFALLMNISLRPLRWRQTLARTVLITIAMILYFGSLPIMSVAEAAAGLFTSPIFVLLFTAILYKEAIGWRRISAVAIGTIGVIIVLRPGSNGFQLLQLMPVAAGAFYALSSMVTRRWCADENPITMVCIYQLLIGSIGGASAYYFGIMPVSDSLFETAPFFFTSWQPMDFMAWFWMFLQALLSVIALVLLTKGYQSADTSYVAIFEYSLLIFASIWTYILWGSNLPFSSFVGFAMIAISGVIISRALPKMEAENASEAR